MSDPVIIAGAGPTGLMLAAELGLAKVPVVFLERRTEPTSWSQAFAIHMSTYEMFKQRGLDRFPDAPRFPNYNFGFPGVVAMDEGKVPRIVPQRRVEQLLAERVAEYGVEIRRGHEVVDFAQDDTGVTVTVRTPDGDYPVRGSYLVGCDGGRSVVRKIAGIDFPGTEATLCGRTGDMEILDEQHQGGVAVRMLPKGLAAVIRHPDEPGMFRGTVVEFDTERPAEEIPVTAEEFRAALQRVTGIDLHIGRTGWMTRFGDSVRHADRYRNGRVFIAGDAAHVHFPSAGQGLNTGMQDAVNLGWKLAGAVHGWAPEHLLDTYHSERHPVGHEACVYPQAQVALMYPFEQAAPLRWLFAELVRSDDVKQYLVDRSSGLGISYPMDYPQLPAGAHPLLGRRIPDLPVTTAEGERRVVRMLCGGHGVVLSTTGDTTKLGDLSGWRDRVDVVAAQPTPDIDAATLLIRPDGQVAYVALDGADDGGLQVALTAWFGAPQPG
jgi:bifunctional hydroxylase/dehydrase